MCALPPMRCVVGFDSSSVSARAGAPVKVTGTASCVGKAADLQPRVINKWKGRVG
jgi:hypothetical protein